MKPVCLVIGAGAGIGGTVGTKFASEGYHAVLCRRSDKDGLDKLVDGIKAAGGEATGLLLNAIEDNAIEDAVRPFFRRLRTWHGHRSRGAQNGLRRGARALSRALPDAARALFLR